MAICTRFGSDVEITAARLIPIWVERAPFEIKWHYSKPVSKVLHRKSTVKEIPMWHYQGKYTDNGELVCDGKWVEAGSLRADDGWKEIQAKLDELNPEDAAAYGKWNKKDAPAASHFFKPITEKEAA